MYADYINTLINDLPNNVLNNEKGTIKKIDLILDGGAFNGSYMIGSLMFLKEMESKNLISIDNISGCSIGALCGLLYSTDSLELFNFFYKKAVELIKTNKQITGLYDLLHEIRGKLPDNFYKKLKKPLYITYYNAIKREKIIKSTFENDDDLIETIRRSCHVPFVVEGRALHVDTYMDGITPYILKEENIKDRLFIHLTNLNKVFNILSIKNENTNSNRVLTGILDIHTFFIKNYDTELCSYIYDNAPIQKIYFYIRYLLENIIMYLMFFYVIFFRPFINSTIENKNIFIIQLAKHLYSQLIIFVVDYYCI